MDLTWAFWSEGVSKKAFRILWWVPINLDQKTVVIATNAVGKIRHTVRIPKMHVRPFFSLFLAHVLQFNSKECRYKRRLG